MSQSEERRKITRAAGVVSLATLGSRVMGFLRDMVVAFLFGASLESDAFLVAFRIPNLLRRLFAEGALTISFIPVFTEVMRRQGKEEALLLLRGTFTALAAAVTAVCLLGLLFAPQLIMVIAPGFAANPASLALSVELTRWCLPYVLFICLAALAAGALNANDHFLAPAASPMLLNLSMIGCALLLAPRVDPPILSLAVGVLLGGAAQLLCQLPVLRAKGYTLRPLWIPRDPGLRRVLRLMGPAAFGAAVHQVTILVNTILASLLATGSVSYLYYAERLTEFPIGLAAIGISSAILPSLARQAADRDHQGLVDNLGFGLRGIFFLILPAMVGILVLAEPLITLLFMRGRFTPEDVAHTVRALIAYAAGLWAFSASRVVASVFFALQDTKTPVAVGAVCMVVNVATALVLCGPLQHAGLALATSVAGILNLVGLLVMLRRRLGRLGLRDILAGALRCLGLSLVMALVAGLVAYWPPWGELGRWWHLLARPLAAMAAGMAVYAMGAHLLGVPELRHLRAMLGRRRPRGGGPGAGGPLSPAAPERPGRFDGPAGT